MLVDQLGGEAWPCREETSSNGLNPCGLGGAEAASKEELSRLHSASCRVSTVGLRRRFGDVGREFSQSCVMIARTGVELVPTLCDGDHGGHEGSSATGVAQLANGNEGLVRVGEYMGLAGGWR